MKVVKSFPSLRLRGWRCGEMVFTIEARKGPEGQGSNLASHLTGTSALKQMKKSSNNRSFLADQPKQLWVRSEFLEKYVHWHRHLDSDFNIFIFECLFESSIIVFGLASRWPVAAQGVPCTNYPMSMWFLGLEKKVSSDAKSAPLTLPARTFLMRSASWNREWDLIKVSKGRRRDNKERDPSLARKRNSPRRNKKILMRLSRK